MKIQKNDNGYVLWLSHNDTYNWANKSGSSWPCSMLSGNRLRVIVDSNGLCDITVNGKDTDCDIAELIAVVSDHIPADCRKYWPTWEF